MSEYASVFKELGIGLSRFLRYTYGSFLLFMLALIIKPKVIQETFKDIDTTVLVLGFLVVGVGVYVFHRGLVIPIHHFIVCLLFSIYDKIIICVMNHDYKSSNPVAILDTWEVPIPLRIVSYTILRRTDYFDGMKRDLNLEHAENGLLVMTSEGMLAAILFSCKVHNPQIGWLFLLIMGVLFLFFSFPPAFVLHSLEGRYMMQPENAKKARQYLREVGIPVKNELDQEGVLKTKTETVEQNSQVPEDLR